jgi:AraC family transcriptional regulator
MDTSKDVPAPTSRDLSVAPNVQGSGSRDTNDVLANLLATASVALHTDPHAAKSCIQGAAILLGIELSLGADKAKGRSCLQGGLTLWQAQRLRSYIEGQLDSSIRATDLAGLVRLSPSHFSRAFRKTFGESPLAYVMKQRVRRAQELMLSSRLPLSQVALECGMCDQAHLSRTFRRIVGINPKTWRGQFPVRPAHDGTLARDIGIRTSR